MLAVYLTLIFSEGDNDVWAIVPWAGLMAMGPILAVIAGIVTVDRDARILLIASAALSFGVGVLAILSIGIGFLAAGAVALYGANQLRPRE
jgi:hypothetical protein